MSPLYETKVFDIEFDWFFTLLTINSLAHWRL